MNHLALKIRAIHDISIDDADPSDPGSSQVKKQRRTQTTAPDAEHGCTFQAHLAGLADLRKDQMPGVTLTLLWRQSLKSWGRRHERSEPGTFRVSQTSIGTGSTRRSSRSHQA